VINSTLVSAYVNFIFKVFENTMYEFTLKSSEFVPHTPKRFTQIGSKGVIFC